MLEEMLADYRGTVLLVSHDRDFLDRVVNGVLAPDGDGRWLEYAGGYSDMMAQRGADLARPQAAKDAAAKSAEKPAAAKNAPSAKRRLSFHEKHALETLPGKIAALEETIAQLHARLDDPNLFARDRKRFDEISIAMAAAQHELAAAEENWLALELLRESLEGN